MKKTVLLLTLFFSISAFSQIKILKNENLVEVGKDNAITLYKKNNRYTFNYQDVNTANLNTFRSFSFSDLNKDFDTLYKLISDGFIDMPSSEITLELPNDIVGLNFAKNYGQITVQFVQYINKNKKYIGKSQFLTKRQVDKIFGKDKNKSVASAERQIIDPREVNKPTSLSPVAAPVSPASKSVPRKKK